MSKLAGNIFKILNVFLAGLYMLTCLIPVLPTSKFWMVAILGLGFPILFFVVLVFMIGWLVARSKWFLVSLVAILISWNQVSVVFGTNTDNFTIHKPDSTLRVFTWNLSSWGETNKNRRMTPELQKEMRAFIKAQEADVLCLQEFYDLIYQQKNISILQLFKDAGYKYHYFERTTIADLDYKTGVAIMSKYPILDTAKFSFGEKDVAESLIYADIQFRGKLIRVFTTHLQSVRFDAQQYASIRKIKNTDEPSLQESRTIISKLKVAYQYRGSQADLVNEKIRSSPHPVVICGDFNDVPNSYTYFKIKGELQDAFIEKGNKLGRTFRYISPTLRIDYIMADKQFAVEQFKRFVVPYSDHYPIVADFKVSGQ